MGKCDTDRWQGEADTKSGNENNSIAEERRGKLKENAAIARTTEEPHIFLNFPHFNDSDIENENRIAYGAQGCVYSGHLGNFGEVAIKKFTRSIPLIEKSPEHREIDVIGQIRHPKIVQLFGIIIDKYEPSCCSGFAMEYMKIVIHDKSKDYDLNQVFSWIKQASLGLMYLHDIGIIHRDIKPSNLLLGHDIDDLKVGDFGFARSFPKEGEGALSGGIGTFLYMAPEVDASRIYGKPAENYSFTITIWEMIHRKVPYEEIKDVSPAQLANLITDGTRPSITSNKVDSVFRALLQRGWDPEPSKRTSIKEFSLFAGKDSRKNNISSPAISQKKHPVDIDTYGAAILIGLETTRKIYILTKNSSWVELYLELPKLIKTYSMFCFKNELYIFGDNEDSYKLTSEMQWIRLADPKKRHCYILTTADSIWALGGLDSEGDPTNTVKMYVAAENCWIEMPPMIERRGGATAAAAWEEKIFACGGWNDLTTPSTTVESYCMRANVWTIFVNLPEPWDGKNRLFANESLLVITNEYKNGLFTPQKSVWKINTTEKNAAWKTVSLVEKTHSPLLAVSLLEEIHIFEGDLEGDLEIFNREYWKEAPIYPGGQWTLNSISLRLAAQLLKYKKTSNCCIM